jgi:EmrB/QacA subfamily drug resistance transporter
MTAEQNRSRWTALLVLCSGVLMIVLDATIVNVALPSIQSDLGFSEAGLAWVVNAYLIAFGGLLLLAGRLGDLASRRGVFVGGLALFTLASALCGAAQTQEMLVAARFVQGIGGAMASAVTLGMIVTMFPEPREQAKAIGVFGFVASAGGSIGLLLGGVLTEGINWHWIFFVNVPVGIATAVAARRLIERDRGIGLDKGADVPGAVLITGSLMLAVFTIVKPAADRGWGDSLTLLLLAASALLLAAFVAREATARTPLIPLRIFRSRQVAGANVIQALTVAGMFGQGFLGALFFQRVLHYSPLETGLAFLPLTIVMGTLQLRYAGPLTMRFGARRVLVAGLLLTGAGLGIFSLAPADATYATNILPAMLVMAAGIGISFPALVGVAMSGARPEEAGLASGLVNTTVQVGGALGLAVLATLASSRTEDAVAAGASQAAALTDGYHLAFLLSALLVLAATAVALVVLERDEPVGNECPEPVPARC